MIFIILGSQRFQFNRLLKAVDGLISDGSLTDLVFAQSGYSDYKPHNYQFVPFLDRNVFMKYEAEADIVITHGGSGAIIGALKRGKKVIAVPRLARYGEHVDDHQCQIINQFKEQNLICGLSDVNQLKDAIAYVKTHEFDRYISNTGRILKSIEQYIDEYAKVRENK